MGLVANITHDKFPKATKWQGMRVIVCFHFDTEHPIMGTIVREDEESPYVTIIKLDDGRHVLGTECQYNLHTIFD